MVTIFVKTGCRFCARTLAALNAYSVQYEEKNIESEIHAHELIARGGKRQVPFFIDGGVQMYESDDIVSYVEATYGKKTSETLVKPRVHVTSGSAVCIP